MEIEEEGAIVTCLKVPPQDLSQRTEEDHKLSCDAHSLNHDSNRILLNASVLHYHFVRWRGYYSSYREIPSPPPSRWGRPTKVYRCFL
jgi:hypothetical protein